MSEGEKAEKYGRSSSTGPLEKEQGTENWGSLTRKLHLCIGASAILCPLQPPPPSLLLSHNIGLKVHRAKRESFLPLPRNAMGPAKIHRQGYSVGSLPCFVFTTFSLTLTRHLLDSLPRQGYPGWMASSTETVNRAKWAVELQLSPKTPNLDPPFLRLPLRPGIS